MASSPRALAACGLVLGLAGCIFPDYTFDEPEPSGAGGSQGGSPAQGGAGGNGGTPATVGGMGGSGGSGGNPPVEDCFSAGDEDGDGAADCADSDCEPDVECVDAIPVGWGTFGYVALFQGSSAADPPCPEGALLAVHSGNGNLMNTTASCSACTCGAPAWTGCELTDLNGGQAGVQGVRVRDVACSVGSATNLDDLTVPVAWNGACTGPDQAVGGGSCPGASCNLSVQAQLARPANGSCTPGGGEPTGADPGWGEGIKACKAGSGLSGCDAGKTCVPRPPSPFEPRSCIAKAGDQPCPAGAFSLKSISYSGFDDSRDCSTCSCGAGTGGTCKLMISLFSDAASDTCNTPLAMVESNSCVDLANQRVGSRTSTVSQAPAGGNCPVTGGGVPSGGVTASDPTTFCCLPAD